MDTEYDENYYDNLQENSPYEYCPQCGEFFDDADFDFQICHICGYDANKTD